MGGRSGYHHTIMQASMRACAHHMPDNPLHHVLTALTTSPLGKANWLLGYWPRETLFSSAARQNWIEPDITPLPF